MRALFLPEQFIKTDKRPETPLKNVFPAILFSTNRWVKIVHIPVQYYRISNKERILNNDTHTEQQYGRFYSWMNISFNGGGLSSDTGVILPRVFDTLSMLFSKMHFI